MDDVQIRRMNLDDVEAVYAVETECFTDAWSKQSFIDEMQKNVVARYLVLEVNGCVVGYAGTWVVLDEGHITNIALQKAHRGQGYGKRLVEALVQYAANLGVHYMTLEVRRSNLVAKSLYEGCGFENIGVRKRYYEDNNEDAFLMVLSHMPPVDMAFSEG